MIKTLAAALVAAGLLAAPAYAQGHTAAKPVAVHHMKTTKHKVAVKKHTMKKHLALHHRKAVKHHVKSVKHHAKTLKHQASRVKHHVKKAG